MGLDRVLRGRVERCAGVPAAMAAGHLVNAQKAGGHPEPVYLRLCDGVSAVCHVTAILAEKRTFTELKVLCFLE